MPVPLGTYTSTRQRVRSRNSGRSASSINENSKQIKYSATENTLLLDVETATTEGSVKTGDVGHLTITNTGRVPVFAILAYEHWTDATSDSGSAYHVNYLLTPNQKLEIPDSMAVVSDQHVEQLTGTVVSNATPTATANFMYADSGATLGENVEDTTLDFDVSDGDYFRVGDLIQLGINTTTATKIEIMQITAISTNNLTVTRALYGTTANDKDAQTHGTSGAVSGAKVYLPYFNTYGGEYNRYTVAQVNAGGFFHAYNFFGVGRAGTHLMGITKGSVAIKFYNAGYQNLTNDGDINSATNSGLTLGETYYLSVALDGGSTDAITFTVSNTTATFGGADGIVSKLQASLDELYYNPAKNNYEKRATVSLEEGNLRITSGQRLSTSAVSVTTNTAGTAGTNELFDTSNVIGRFPATIPTAISASLPEDVFYDGSTYESQTNDVFMVDDGEGNLVSNGLGHGSINYETGEVWLASAPANSEFVYSCLHTSCFSGRKNATDSAKKNTLKAVYGNVPNQKENGKLSIVRR